MKKLILFLTAALLLIGCNVVGLSQKRAAPFQEKPESGNLIIHSSPGSFDLAAGWADQYSENNKQAHIQVLALGVETQENLKILKNNLILASDYENRDLCSNAAWKMVIGRDPIVPVISSSNPFIETISRSGLTAEKVSLVLSSENPLTWDQLLGNGSTEKVDVNIEDNESVLSSLVSFTGISESSLVKNRTEGREGLMSLFASNPGAIAFIRLSEVLASDKESLDEGIALMPFDLNSNGRIDGFESIYGTSQSFLRGVWIGKYPRTLVHHLYLLSEAQPSDENQLDFLNYILMNGEVMLAGSNFVSPVNVELQSIKARLQKYGIPEQEVVISRNGPAIVIIFIAVIMALLYPLLIRTVKKPAQILKTANGKNYQPFTPEIIKKPQGILYDQSHTWTYMEKDGRVRLGIDDFLQHVVGPLTRVKLLNPGDHVKKGEKIIILSNRGKQIAIKSPVSGIVIEQNNTLFSNPSLINNSPYSEGWIYMIDPANWQAETRIMLMGTRYADWLKTEFSRLKDFLIWAVQSNQDKYDRLILTDGGEVPDNALNQLGVEIWEEFQHQFIDKSIKI